MNFRLIATLTLAMLCYIPTFFGQTADSLVNEGRQAIETRDLGTAKEKLEAALQLEASHADANALFAIVRLAGITELVSTQNALAPFGLSSSFAGGSTQILETQKSFPVTVSLGKWSYYRDSGADGTDALLSGSPPPGFRSEISTTLEGPGTLKFDWATFTQSWSDHQLSLLEDGNQVLTLANDSDWNSAQYTVP